MFAYERHQEVRRLLFRYLESPSLRHLREPKQVDRLAEEIVAAVDQSSPLWGKWDAVRAELLKAAAKTWIPIEDLASFLNSLPGPRLTATDVAQRLRAFQEEPHAHLYPDERVKDACLARYSMEVEAGTEMPAIVGALQEFADEEERRLDREWQEKWQAEQAAERLALERRFLSGADCKWTPLEGSKAVFMRRNGRAYRLAPTKEKRWELHRIEEATDAGKLVGVYATRSAANKVIDKIAYEPEFR
ncbi:hypothetical protein [Brevundimonas sp.]|uniref:hypothetical protein n=1 Tax=Brevundimonas sp. TaxID=1871086 RepID=UPI00261AEDEE|nr:hypothetical protein [Brevundimonas sp.]